jgi:hypothetical protein
MDIQSWHASRSEQRHTDGRVSSKWAANCAREETTVLGEPRGPKTELRLSPRQIVEAVEAGGLVLARLVELPPYH